MGVSSATDNPKRPETSEKMRENAGCQGTPLSFAELIGAGSGLVPKACLVSATSCDCDCFLLISLSLSLSCARAMKTLNKVVEHSGRP